MDDARLRAMNVATLLEAWPQTLKVLLRHGFTPLANPFARAMLARTVTVEQACKLKGRPLDEVLRDLGEAIRDSQSD
jgi:hypothetical protein